MQTRVTFDQELQQYSEEYEPVKDALVKRYLEYRSQTSYKSPIDIHSWKAKVKCKLPFSKNVSEPEFLPTMQMLFLEKLNHFFPKHRLILSDFDSLPTEVEGVDAPVVQTRQRYRMIPCSTYLVAKGWFDIFFPTNFELMQEVYGQIRPRSESRVETHREFLEKYAQLDKCRVKSGEVPMLEHYSNVKFFLS